MGHVREIPQVTQDGQKSGQVGLEITYGGKESPFGGIDSSAPPAYIAPNCLAGANGFLVVDNQLILAGLQPITLPTLWNGQSGVTLLKVGTFYGTNIGYLNYAFGVSQSVISGPPNGLIYTFYMTSWRYTVAGGVSLQGNDTLQVKLFNTTINPVAASLTLPVLMGQNSSFTDAGSLALNYGASNVSVGSVSYSYTGGATISTVVAGMVAAINGVSGSTLFSAAPSVDGLSIVLTATTPGAAGNNLQVSDLSSDTTTPTNPPPYFFPTNSGVNWTNLSGGADAVTFQPPQFNANTVVSTAEVGGTLYLAGLGPMILKYSGVGKFFVSTLYAGVKYIAKFAGSLIGLGNIPQLLNTVQNSDMVFSWSASNNLDEWSPVTTSGNVTGAGFTQLDDIGDALRGLVVTNNTAFILRTQGLSYSTALGSGEDPFSFQHVSLADEGEGAQQALLICQYDQTGAFVGNTDVYQISGSISSIGEKINSQLLAQLETTTGPVGSSICAMLLGKRVYPVTCFMINNVMYMFNPEDKTWMNMSFTAQFTNTKVTVLSYANSNTSIQRLAYLTLIFSGVNQASAYVLTEGTSASQINATPLLIFPQEELLFGRDVTIDALYFSLNYNVTTTMVLTFSFNGVTFNTLTLAAGSNINANPLEVQLFPSSQVFTSHSPQLSIQVSTIGVCTALRFSKIQLYASFDPNQRPV